MNLIYIYIYTHTLNILINDIKFKKRYVSYKRKKNERYVYHEL
jgi:hypothetical protein